MTVESEGAHRAGAGAQADLFAIEAAAAHGSVNLSPCERCGATSGVIIPGSGPHWRGLRCPCGQFRKWLPKPRGVA
jgi:hypothetical protein